MCNRRTAMRAKRFLRAYEALCKAARAFALSVICAALFSCAARLKAQLPNYAPQGEQFPGPACNYVPQYNGPPARRCSPEEIQYWLDYLTRWRIQGRMRAGDAANFQPAPDLAWAEHDFIQPQVMVHDRYLYDPDRQMYTVKRFLQDVNERYGGVDSVLLWHTYPNIGIDDRNQYDMFRDLPGGLSAVRTTVDDFHRHGVKVFFPVMLWDQGTRDEGRPDWESIAEEMKEVDADGVNGDTTTGMPAIFAETAKALHHPLILEPELGLAADEMLQYNQSNWGYWHYDFTPSVSRYKWLEPTHMVHLCARWSHDHTDDLQEAFFNGIGFESWENVWGIWNQLTPRDAEALRRIALIERRFADMLTSPQWEPHTPSLQYGVFASKWPLGQNTLWTIVNRNAYSVSGEQLSISAKNDLRYFDLWHGRELHPEMFDGAATLSFEIEPRGYGAILAVTAVDDSLQNFLNTMAQQSERPLSSYSDKWQSLAMHIVDIPSTQPYTKAPEGMVKISGGEFRFQVNGIEIEGMNDDGVDVQYPWESSPRRYHDHLMHIKPFWMDRTPVTNAEFKRFLDAAHYRPQDNHNFLRDWQNGSYPEGEANKPVTWVSIEDARAYAQWAGKRLPHEWEWQYAAQGGDGRAYPWGNTWNIAAAPTPDHGRTMAPAADVDAHPLGDSASGVEDLVGNVWQWTDEYRDSHTRAAILRGGSHYQPLGAIWYFPQAYKLSEHGKYLLMAPSLDRSGAIGFRCVADAPADPNH